jgi:peptidoglycan hydrolase CwlO-like protein
VIANRDAKIAHLQDRQKELARIVSNRDAKIERLRTELQARYEELAALQREIVRSSLSGRAKRLVRPISRLLR